MSSPIASSVAGYADWTWQAGSCTPRGPDGRAVDLPYDTLVVAAGATHSYFGHDEWAQFAPGMKTVEDARQVRDHILSAFEMAELATDPQERAEWLTFVVIGAGPTGVELAGQIAELAHDVLSQDYRMQRIITFGQAHHQMLPARGQDGPASVQAWARRGRSKFVISQDGS